jgi:anti-sigma factor RsiW
VDCNTARMLITFFGRQGAELAPEDAADLNAHLAACPKCAAAVQFERAFDSRIARAMMAVPVPPDLKARLIDGISAHRGA